MKLEWRKHEKDLYSLKELPIIIDVPRQKYIMISGTGNPNNEDFAQHIGALMSVAYPIKMNFKNYMKENPDNAKDYPCSDYTVYPLEGVWTSSEKNGTNKDAYQYTIMVRQPDFITASMVEEALQKTKKTKPTDLLDEIVFSEIAEHLVVQMLHVGTYDSEPETFLKMDKFVEENRYQRIDNKFHKEIYLSDFRKTEPEKLKTLLRYNIKKI